VRRGEVWWAVWPAGQRHPVLLLSWDAHATWRDRVTVAEITRTVRDLDAEVHLGPEDGMPDYCVANLDNLAAVPKAALEERICALSRRRMGEVELAIHRALGLAVPCTVGEEAG
jgi:mRNA interferase MazF